MTRWCPFHCLIHSGLVISLYNKIWCNKHCLYCLFHYLSFYVWNLILPHIKECIQFWPKNWVWHLPLRFLCSSLSAIFGATHFYSAFCVHFSRELSRHWPSFAAWFSFARVQFFCPDSLARPLRDHGRFSFPLSSVPRFKCRWKLLRKTFSLFLLYLEDARLVLKPPDQRLEFS
jgi:hypothetical protein